MRSRYSIEVMAGLFLLLGVVALMFLASTATDMGSRLGKEHYSLSMRFLNVGELKSRAPVTIGGVTIGAVRKINLDPVTFEALVIMDINSKFDQIPTDTSASILTTGILGDKYVGLEPGGALEVLSDGGEITITQSAIGIEQLIAKYLFSVDNKGS
ncbi:MAG: outer membrane lipid asymmetry maintenance protein MlaD [Xanthomonadales bacterium]|nr:outer membrane lipid asymmetry maintenance protein MlaD [Xanthomonadales bacterium]